MKEDVFYVADDYVKTVMRGAIGENREKLEAEGITFVDGHVNMEKHNITEEDFEVMRAELKNQL